MLKGTLRRLLGANNPDEHVLVLDPSVIGKLDLFGTGKKTWGGAGTPTGHTGAHGHTYGTGNPVRGSSDLHCTRVVDGGVTATGVLSRERGNLITICNTL